MAKDKAGKEEAAGPRSGGRPPMQVPSVDERKKLLAQIAPGGVSAEEEELFDVAVDLCVAAPQLDRPLILIGGPSGVGKSHFVRHALAPRLALGGARRQGGPTDDGRGQAEEPMSSSHASATRARPASGRAGVQSEMPSVVEQNASALREDLAPGLLLGWKKGVHSTAFQDDPGLLGRAAGGVLFLDEMGKSCMTLQSCLLTVIDEGKYRRLGDDQDQRCTASLILGAAENLEELAAQGLFLRDLLRRVRHTVILPVLMRRRHRVADVAQAIWSGLTPEGMAFPHLVGELLRTATMLELLHWPGNYHELREVLEGFKMRRCVDRSPHKAYGWLRTQLHDKVVAQTNVRIVLRTPGWEPGMPPPLDTSAGVHELTASHHSEYESMRARKELQGSLDDVFSTSWPWWFAKKKEDSLHRAVLAAQVDPFAAPGSAPPVGLRPEELASRYYSAAIDFWWLQSSRTELPVQELSDKLGVSDTTIGNRAEELGIPATRARG